MREILFRGKRTDDGEWVYGYYGVKGLDTDLEKHYVIQETLNTATRDNFFYFTDIEVVPKTVGQYTGLKDKNGTEIYEGDIVKSYAGTFASPVEWNESYCGFYPFCAENTSFHVAECEIVGNIHDNTELLVEQRHDDWYDYDSDDDYKHY